MAEEFAGATWRAGGDSLHETASANTRHVANVRRIPTNLRSRVHVRIGRQKSIINTGAVGNRTRVAILPNSFACNNLPVEIGRCISVIQPGATRARPWRQMRRMRSIL